jgi:hypothetical protein
MRKGGTQPECLPPHCPPESDGRTWDTPTAGTAHLQRLRIHLTRQRSGEHHRTTNNADAAPSVRKVSLRPWGHHVPMASNLGNQPARCDVSAFRVEAGSPASVRRNRNCVLNLPTSYRNPMVKHEPELHRSLASSVCCQTAAKNDQVPFAVTSKGTLTRAFVVAGGFEPPTSGL